MNHGFTLLEMMVSVGLGTFVIAASYTVVAENGRAVARTKSDVGAEQSTRMAMDLITQDLRQAGVGVGYAPDGSFAGLMRGTFTVRGGANFRANGGTIELKNGRTPTDDLGLRFASGRARTVAAYAGSAAQVCAGSKLKAGDVAVFVDALALHVRTVVVAAVAPAGCSSGTCIGGCESINFSSDSGYVSHPSAINAEFGNGELLGSFAEVVWFVVPGEFETGELRRVAVDAKTPCAQRNTDCGGTVARNVEMLQVRVMQWDRQLNDWSNVTDQAIDNRRRLRVDVEMVASGVYQDLRAHRYKLDSELDPGGCNDGPCAAEPADYSRRRMSRTSVEIRNSGRMQIR